MLREGWTSPNTDCTAENYTVMSFPKSRSSLTVLGMACLPVPDGRDASTVRGALSLGLDAWGAISSVLEGYRHLPTSTHGKRRVVRVIANTLSVSTDHPLSCHCARCKIPLCPKADHPLSLPMPGARGNGVVMILVWVACSRANCALWPMADRSAHITRTRFHRVGGPVCVDCSGVGRGRRPGDERKRGVPGLALAPDRRA